MSSLIKTHSRSTTQTDEHARGIAGRHCPALMAYLDLIYPDAEVKALGGTIGDSIDRNEIQPVLDIYTKSIRRLEKHIWASEKTHELSGIYQSLFHETEQLHQLIQKDHRHDFLIVIPVADRPVQLTNCIKSLVRQCETFRYGGTTEGRYNRISVMIADDSIDPECSKRIRQLTEETTRLGINTTYFGRHDQQQLVDSLTDDDRTTLKTVIESTSTDEKIHLGPSVMRNLCYLYLNRHYHDSDNTVFYFIDSDQLFTVDPVDTDRQPINYFYHLDRIFSHDDIRIVTGKVVGDPPVSPAVMANTLLDDTIHFIDSILKQDAGAACEFHQHHNNDGEDASYHDMANLFGFGKHTPVYEYQCPLQGRHTNLDCLKNYAEALKQFFYGEHPTRATRFSYSYPPDSIAPARTVYTGNYAFTRKALSSFIPFSGLRLRMAGPTLGRILRSRLGPGFVSVNLPMLHKRTLNETGMAEFRTGVNQDSSSIDLGQEFKRQYFGDVMLFSIEQLCKAGFPEQLPDVQAIRETVMETERRMNGRYNDKQKLLLAKLNLLQSYMDQLNSHDDYALKPISKNLEQFVANIHLNYDKDALTYSVINDAKTKQSTLEAIIESIRQYPDHQQHWNRILAAQQ